MLDLTFHHLGLAVSSPEAARRFLSALDYRILPEMHDPLQQVNLQLCQHDTMPDVEIIWPGESAASPLGKMLSKRDGLIYHMCYSTENVKAALASLETLDLRVIPVAPAKPAVLLGGLLVSFYYVHDIGLIELIHTP